MSDVSISLSGIAASASNSLRASVDNLGIGFPLSPGRPAGGDDTNEDFPSDSSTRYVGTTTMMTIPAIKPMACQRSSPSTARSGKVTQHGSSNTSCALSNAMPCFVLLLSLFCRVPFDAHLYLQYCPYQHVKSTCSSVRFGTFDYRTRAAGDFGQNSFSRAFGTG